MALEWTAEDVNRTARLRRPVDGDDASPRVSGVLVIEHNTVRLTAEELRELATMATALADQAER